MTDIRTREANNGGVLVEGYLRYPASGPQEMHY